MFLLSRTACATVHHPDPDLGSNSPSRSSFQPDNQTGSPYPSDEKRPHDEVNLTMFLYLTLVGGVRVRLSEGRAYIIQQICLIKKAFFLTSVVSPVDEEVLSAEDTLSTLIKQRRSYCQTKFIDITEHFYPFVLYHPCTFSSHEKTL